ncbi:MULTISPECIES: hypothetical protein [Micrococcus]|uniref:hypothetical protein n=1 Tax=Micrococcus TaxID=1269 RepID=UPI001CCC7D9C|nr:MULTISPECIES: hypothetical protein [Micrococcus]MCG7423199.1 hypothetical protein [Micrococcus sp. ACRRV]UBH25658.1 hypothetical protein KW076_05635 [Micrococcus porci]
MSPRRDPGRLRPLAGPAALLAALWVAAWLAVSVPVCDRGGPADWLPCVDPGRSVPAPGAP